MNIRTKYIPPKETNVPGVIYLPDGAVMDNELFEPTPLFDDLYFFGTKFIGALVIKTGEGLVMIDSMQCRQDVEDVVIPSMKKMGLDPADIKTVIITHGHFDHFGGAKYLQDKFGCKVMMTKMDEDFMTTSWAPDQYLPMEFPRVDEYLEDGSVVRLGQTEFKIMITPGHTPGCISLVFPVHENGKEHKVAVWGGIGLPESDEDNVIFLESAKRFMAFCQEEHADVEFSMHPFVDYSIEKMEALRERKESEPNPLVTGEAYVRLFMECCIINIENRLKSCK